jgi:hypothetical protein
MQVVGLREGPMPQIVRFYVKHVIIGFAVSAALVGGLLGLNIGNLWHLASTSDVGLLAVFLLWVFNGIVFAGVQFGIAIMGLAERDNGDGGGPAPVLLPITVPVTVPVHGRRRR